MLKLPRGLRILPVTAVRFIKSVRYFFSEYVTVPRNVELRHIKLIQRDVLRPLQGFTERKEVSISKKFVNGLLNSIAGLRVHELYPWQLSSVYTFAYFVFSRREKDNICMEAYDCLLRGEKLTCEAVQHVINDLILNYGNLPMDNINVCESLTSYDIENFRNTLQRHCCKNELQVLLAESEDLVHGTVECSNKEYEMCRYFKMFEINDRNPHKLNNFENKNPETSSSNKSNLSTECDTNNDLHKRKKIKIRMDFSKINNEGNMKEETASSTGKTNLRNLDVLDQATKNISKEVIEIKDIAMDNKAREINYARNVTENVNNALHGLPFGINLGAESSNKNYSEQDAKKNTDILSNDADPKLVSVTEFCKKSFKSNFINKSLNSVNNNRKLQSVFPPKPLSNVNENISMMETSDKESSLSFNSSEHEISGSRVIPFAEKIPQKPSLDDSVNQIKISDDTISVAESLNKIPPNNEISYSCTIPFVEKTLQKAVCSGLERPIEVNNAINTLETGNNLPFSHKLSNTNQDRKIYVCPKCGMRLSTEPAYNQHIATQHSKKEARQNEVGSTAAVEIILPTVSQSKKTSKSKPQNERVSKSQQTVMTPTQPSSTNVSKTNSVVPPTHPQITVTLDQQPLMQHQPYYQLQQQQQPYFLNSRSNVNNLAEPNIINPTSLIWSNTLKPPVTNVCGTTAANAGSNYSYICGLPPQYLHSSNLTVPNRPDPILNLKQNILIAPETERPTGAVTEIPRQNLPSFQNNVNQTQPCLHLNELQSYLQPQPLQIMLQQQQQQHAQQQMYQRQQQLHQQPQQRLHQLPQQQLHCQTQQQLHQLPQQQLHQPLQQRPHQQPQQQLHRQTQQRLYQQPQQQLHQQPQQQLHQPLQQQLHQPLQLQLHQQPQQRLHKQSQQQLHQQSQQQLHQQLQQQLHQQLQQQLHQQPQQQLHQQPQQQLHKQPQQQLQQQPQQQLHHQLQQQLYQHTQQQLHQPLQQQLHQHTQQQLHQPLQQQLHQHTQQQLHQHTQQQRQQLLQKPHKLELGLQTLEQRIQKQQRKQQLQQAQLPMQQLLELIQQLQQLLQEPHKLEIMLRILEQRIKKKQQKHLLQQEKLPLQQLLEMIQHLQQLLQEPHKLELRLQILEQRLQKQQQKLLQRLHYLQQQLHQQSQQQQQQPQIERWRKQQQLQENQINTCQSCFFTTDKVNSYCAHKSYHSHKAALDSVHTHGHEMPQQQREQQQSNTKPQIQPPQQSNTVPQIQSQQQSKTQPQIQPPQQSNTQPQIPNITQAFFNPDKPFGCQFCENSYATDSELMKHFISTHTDYDESCMQLRCCICDNCEKSPLFDSLELLREHMDKVHNFTCNPWNKMYKSHERLLRHCELEHNQNTPYSEITVKTEDTPYFENYGNTEGNQNIPYSEITVKTEDDQNTPYSEITVKTEDAEIIIKEEPLPSF